MNKAQQSSNEEHYRYSNTARIIHWLMAVCFMFMWACGYSMTSLVADDSFLQELLFGLHISIGVTLLVLLVLRIVIRFTHRVPPLPDELGKWEKLGSHIGHFTLYFLSAVIIVIGWAEVDFGGYGVEWFGVAMPKLFPTMEFLWGFNLEETSATLHMWFAYAMLVITIIHIAAVLKHRCLDDHDLLTRMTWTRKI
jgi:cytochrome b561